MGEISIRFRMNMESGKKDIVIDYESEEDAMRHEHEQHHRQIVERLVGEGVLQADEVGEVTVERAAPGQEAARREPPPQEGQAEAASSG